MCSIALLLVAVFATAARGQAPTDGSALVQGGPVGQAATPAPVKVPAPAPAPVPTQPPTALPGYGASMVRLPRCLKQILAKLHNFREWSRRVPQQLHAAVLIARSFAARFTSSTILLPVTSTIPLRTYSALIPNEQLSPN